ncbi:MAG: hypothetical protein NVS2B9_02610 [Myxococcales bacterium]
MKKWIAVLAALGMPVQAQAWGGRGHAAICETAVFLLKEQGLKEVLQTRPQMMGHLCNVPDTEWRSLGTEATKTGNPTHYIDVELIAPTVREVPTDFAAIVATYTGKPNRFKSGTVISDVPTEVGSIWWRADQFYRRSLWFNESRAVQGMVVSLGLMGHFVGDVSQPLHNTADYDGYAKGHGGLHAYYEDDVVGEFDGDLQARVLERARALGQPGFLARPTVIEKMKALSEVTASELKTVVDLDPTTAPSSDGVGGSQKHRAKRASAAEGHRRLSKLILTELSRSALLLARLWDDAYVAAGRPDLSAIKTQPYPLRVDFVPPDYLPAPATAATKK